jgi:hydroxyacylglutathione hydrolase
MTQPFTLQIADKGLGNTAYLVDLGDGRALAVDASRDLRALEAAAETRGLRVAVAADTHLHADFLSGARQPAATRAATVLVSAAGKRRFDHHGLSDGDEFDLGGLRLRALGTPGHTDEHLSYLLLDDEQPVGVFTGGSLLVGAVARTDLVDPDRTIELARAQYRSVQRLLELPDDVEVWPTHGAGSFCAAPAGSARTSTIGSERATNPLLSAHDEEAFVARLLGSLGSFPPYFLRLSEVNRRGPAVLPRRHGLEQLTPQTAAAAQAAGAMIVDARPVISFATGHPRGALSIPLRPAFASWLGWLAPHDKPIVVLREPDQDVDEVLWQAAKIGYDNIIGELAGGQDAWSAAGLPTTSVPLVEASATADARVLDIRQEAEYRAGHVPGALNIELGDLPAVLGHLADVPTVVMCGHGERAMGAASLLSAAGFTHVAVFAGSPQHWAAANGEDLASGP